MHIRWSFICVIFLVAACTKEYDFKLDDTKPLYVIEGRISDLQGPYYIRITRSTSLLGYPTVNIDVDSIDAVQGAEVIIKDDMGTVDTLIPAVERHPRRLYFYNNHVLDSDVRDYPSPALKAIRGFYQTTKIRGVPGHNYQLYVRIGDSTFQASAYMPRVTNLDSAAIKRDTVVNATGSIGNLPLAWFREPTGEKNYYMLQYFAHITEYPYDAFRIEYNNNNGYNSIPYVVDDKILPPYVNGLSVPLITPDGNPWDGPGNYIVYPTHGAHIRLSSLTKEAYEYFNVLRKQLQTDGNVYKPTPASARGNIQGGALGLFWASNISYKLMLD
jgi:hypothetical protein